MLEIKPSEIGSQSLYQSPAVQQSQAADKERELKRKTRKARLKKLKESSDKFDRKKVQG